MVFFFIENVGGSLGHPLPLPFTYFFLLHENLLIRNSIVMCNVGAAYSIFLLLTIQKNNKKYIIIIITVNRLFSSLKNFRH